MTTPAKTILDDWLFIGAIQNTERFEKQEPETNSADSQRLRHHPAVGSRNVADKPEVIAGYC